MRRSVILWLAIWLLYGFFTKSTVSLSGNDAARMATVQALVEQGTFAIDDTDFFWTVDKVKIGQRFYSGILCFLPLITSIFYCILYHLFGIGFASSPNVAIFLLTWLTSGACASAIATLLIMITTRTIPASLIRMPLFLFCIAGTWIFSYGTVFNNHVPAALFIMAGWYLLRGEVAGDMEVSNSRHLASGLLLGAAAVTEIVCGGVFLFLTFVRQLFSKIKQRNPLPLLAFVLGLMIPLAIEGTANFIIHKSPLPVYFHPGGYDYEGSIHAANSVAGLRRSSDPINYAMNATIGERGIFSHTPLLLLSIPGIIILLRKKAIDGNPFVSSKRGAFLYIIIAVAASMRLFIIFTSDYGGWAYGFRFFIPIIPFLYMFSLPVIASIMKARVSSLRVLGIAMVIVLISWSVLSALLGVYSPWIPCFEGAEQDNISVIYPHPWRGALLSVIYSHFEHHNWAQRMAYALYPAKKSDLYGYLGLVYLNKGNLGESRVFFQRRLRVLPQDPMALHYLEYMDSLR